MKEIVTETFFEPSLEPMRARPDRRRSTTSGASCALATPAATSVFRPQRGRPHAHHRKSLNIDMSERTAVMHKIHPQGHLAGLVRAIE